jgi:hypothetical protein
MNIYERDQIRQKLLTETYNHTNADTRQPIDFKALGQLLKIENSEIDRAYQFLLNESLIEPYGAGYTVTISHFGIKMVESFIRKIDFTEDKNFNSTEIFQLRILLDEIKEQMTKLSFGQEIIFNEIEESFEKSKTENKTDWKESFEEQIKNWSAQKIIDKSASLIFQGLLVGLKVITE